MSPFVTFPHLNDTTTKFSLSQMNVAMATIQNLTLCCSSRDVHVCSYAFKHHKGDNFGIFYMHKSFPITKMCLYNITVVSVMDTIGPQMVPKRPAADEGGLLSMLSKLLECIVEERKTLQTWMTLTDFVGKTSFLSLETVAWTAARTQKETTLVL